MTTTQTATLPEFLLARIAEDEAFGARHPDWCRSVADDQACDCDGAARVLAECEAKRRIVLMFAGTSHEGPFIAASGIEVCKLLALPYAAHPDYRDEWKP